MGERGEDVLIWFNVDCPKNEAPEILEKLDESAKLPGLKLSTGSCKLAASEQDETLQVEFYPIKMRRHF